MLEEAVAAVLLQVVPVAAATTTGSALLLPEPPLTGISLMDGQAKPCLGTRVKQ